MQGCVCGMYHVCMHMYMTMYCSYNYMYSRPSLIQTSLSEPSIIQIVFQAKKFYSLSTNINNHAHIILIRLVLISVILARSKRLTVRDLMERNSVSCASFAIRS